jgi:hypothetical protein
MKTPIEGVLLRIFIGESDLHEGRPLHERIVEEARARGLAGATVLRGIMGYGAASRVHTAKLLRLSEDLPIVVEIVDTQAQIDTLLPFLDEVVTEGLVTMERAHVIRYRDGDEPDA